MSEDFIYVRGASEHNLKSVDLDIPMTILGMNPIKLEQELIANMPFKAVSIRRRVFPVGLEIEVIERNPIGFANKRTIKGIEDGMIDKDGNWMSLNIARKANPPNSNLFVEGWSDNYKEWITKIVLYNKQTNGQLEKIIISQTGQLSFVSKEFGTVQLGTSQKLLNLQLIALSELYKNIPQRFKNTSESVPDSP